MTMLVLNPLVHVFDHLVDKISSLLRFHNCSPSEKAHAVILYLANLSLREIIAVLASRSRSLLNALIFLVFLKRALKSCETGLQIVIDRGPWYPWALRRLGHQYVHETFGKRNRIERWLKDRTKRFCNNVNAKTIKSTEELVRAIALMHNLILNVIGE
ncbi:MAG: DDE-type integrase/transposase/recombinase [Thermoproteota archaeon]